MNRIFLKFCNQNLENLYQKETGPMILDKLYEFFKIQMVIMIIMGIDFLFIADFSWQSIISFVVYLAFISFFFLAKRFLKSLFRWILIVCFISLGIFYIELIKYCANDDGDGPDGHYSETSLILTMNLQVYITKILLTKMNWMINCGLCFFNLIYFVVRLVNFSEALYRPINISVIVISALTYALLSYKEEKNHRAQFKSIKEYNESLQYFKSLLQNMFPSPIFIINYENNHIEFFNKSATKLLRNFTNGQNSPHESNPNDFSDLFLSKNFVLEDIETFLDSFQIMTEENGENLEQKKVSSILKNFNKEFVRKPSAILSFEQRNDFQEFKKIHLVNNNYSRDATSFTEENPFGQFYELQIGLTKWDNKKCLITIFNNITTTKKIIELQNLDKYKNHMLATVSHDLRTPLNGVIGMVTEVLSKISDEENQRNLEIALRSANLLKFLINDILDFSQITLSKIRLNLERINLKELVGDTVDLMKYQFKKKGLEFFYEIINSAKDNEYIVSDANRIKQILVNLLGNSLKFTFQGFVKLKVEMKVQEKFEDPSILVLFSVQDTGIGIKEEDKPKIFRLFGKLDQDDPQINRNGIGLGLSISNNLAKMLYNQNGYGSEGGIQVESEFGKGSTFFFMISGGSLEPENFSGTSEHKAIRTFTRLCQIEEGQNYKGLGQVIPEFPSEKKIISRLDIRVLIVEDDLINISVLELYLKFFGIAYLVAINGLNAVKIVEEEVIQKNNEISLILMDCNMPIMDGFKASEKIQEMLVRNKREDIPIVAATANTGKEDIEMCRNSGMKYYMEKPIQKKELGLFLQKMFKVSLNI